MTGLSRQGVSNIAAAVEPEAGRGFAIAVLLIKDPGRVILGGACSGVKANNKDKLRNEERS